MSDVLGPENAVYWSYIVDIPRQCPVCQTVLTMTCGMHIDKPPASLIANIDALSICAECCTLLAYTPDGFRIATDEEYQMLDPRIKHIIQYANTTHPRNQGVKS